MTLLMDDGKREILDGLFEGAYVVDLERHIVHWNPAAEEISGYRLDEVRATRCSDNVLVHVDECGQAMCSVGCPLVATMQDGEPRDATLFLHHKHGHRVPVRIRARALRDSTGAIVGAWEAFVADWPDSDLKARAARLESLAMLDELTELPNRRSLTRVLERRVDELERYGWPFGVLMIDIDHFKAVNDRHGHAVGDRVLRMVGRTLAHAARAFDSVGRWGGEEFVGIIANIDRDELGRVAERFRIMVEASSLGTPEGPIGITISVGAAVAGDGEGSESLLNRADQGLYKAKEGGRNRVEIVGAGD